VRRCAIWSPLPPARSGISDYTQELLAPLAELVDVTAVGAPGTALPDDVDVHVYHMGNHAGVHGWIYERALAEPGLVVLHDPSLLDFNLGQLGGLTARKFQDEAVHAHGPIRGMLDDPVLYLGWPAVNVDGVRVLDALTLTMERRLVSASRGVLVHDPYTAALLRQRYPDTPVFEVPHGAQVRDDGTRAATRARFGWHDEHVVLGVFGGFNPIKRILVTVLAFAEVRRRWPHARLLIAGHVDYPDVHADVVRTVEQLGLANSVELVSAPPKDEFADLITATDAVVNLRWPTAGETSGVMMRAFGAGRLVVTTDLPQHRHFDPAFCWRVPVEPAAEAQELIAALERVVCEPDETRGAGKLARDHVVREASWPVVARGYLNAMAKLAPTGATPARQTATQQTAARLGVNLFGDLRSTSGLSEANRRHADALLRTGIGLTYTEFNSRGPNRSVPVPRALAELRGGKDYPVDLWLVNLNEFQLIPDSALDRYTIALWAWELPEILDYTLVQLPRIDELWVVSTFVADAFRTATDIPIEVVPNVVPEMTATPDRGRFGLAEDSFVVLFTFSASSSDARKNPWGVIEAFRRAFGPTERGTSAQLVIKAIDLNIFPGMAAHLAEQVAGVNGTLIGADLTRAEMDSLLASADVYTSLHRSEGFGLGMAEAMLLGKPVVATGYGGNTDFMPPGAAGLVGYDIRPITTADHHFDQRFADWYRPGQLWAEPDVAQAARWLRRLADSPRLRAEMGRSGQAAVRAWSGADAVGARMARRLAEIEPSRSRRTTTPAGVPVR
jgi:glycosyltransferase involved in cell wall biosynthesis